MEPILTPTEMAVVDAASGPMEALIERAGWEVARYGARLMGGCYGRRVVVISGKGNNGADGKVAARYLRQRGARVTVVGTDVGETGEADLIIDAAFGTGLRDRWEGPTTKSPVLAVDIASGLDPVTGEDRGGLDAVVTVTFGGWKPGLLFGSGPRRSGRVHVEPMGLALDAVEASAWRWTDEDAMGQLPRRGAADHKWSNAVRVLGGSSGMEGAPSLTALGALRAGAGMVVVSRPDGGRLDRLPMSAVERSLGSDWVGEALSDIERFSAAVIGPGLGSDPDVHTGVREFVARCPIPLVVDADAIRAVSVDLGCLDGRSAPTVVTPHDGEFATLAGLAVDEDRLEAARSVRHDGMVLLLKGPATIVTDPVGRCAVITSGDERLATAGTGDVLAGMISAMGLADDTWARVASAAHWHGVAGSLCQSHGAIADDIAGRLTEAREVVCGSSG